MKKRCSPEIKPYRSCQTSHSSDEYVRFRSYLDLGDELKALAGSASLTPAGDRRIQSALNAQAEIIATAARMPASDLTQMSYKAALWRWETSEIDLNGGFETNAALIGFSLYRDIINKTGRDDLAPDVDIDRGIF